MIPHATETAARTCCPAEADREGARAVTADRLGGDEVGGSSSHRGEGEDRGGAGRLRQHAHAHGAPGAQDVVAHPCMVVVVVHVVVALGHLLDAGPAQLYGFEAATRPPAYEALLGSKALPASCMRL